MRDPYATIGVGRDAPLDEVRAAYRKRVDEVAEERFDGATPDDRDGAATRLGDLATAMAAAWAERGDEASGTGQLGPVAFQLPVDGEGDDGTRLRALASTLVPHTLTPPPDDGRPPDRPAPRGDGSTGSYHHLPRATPRRSRRPLIVALAALGVFALGGLAYALVGGGASPNEKPFTATGAPFSFRYPESWPLRGRPRVSTALNRPAYQVAVGPDREDTLLVSTYRLSATVNPDGSATSRNGAHVSADDWWKEVDARIDQVGRAAGMERVGDPEASRLGDLDGRLYRFETKDGELASTFVVAFDGRTQFFVNCQSRKARADDIDRACDRVRATFSPRAPG